MTVGEYLDFLNDLSARGPVDPQLVPRERAVAGLRRDAARGGSGQRRALAQPPARAAGAPPRQPGA